jgi:cell wall-associated NlpC family hydrolase
MAGENFISGGGLAWVEAESEGICGSLDKRPGVSFIRRMRAMGWSLLFWLLILAAPGRGDEVLRQEAAALKAQGIRYGGSYVPAGEAAAWRMDCSNAVRYLMRKTRGIELPRTASEQYNYVRQRGSLRRVGGLFGGVPDASWWSKRLRPGDLLFWEHTYKPQRKPPVTHVMVYLGRDGRGNLLMAGAQNSRGVDIYRLQPRVPYGGYRGGFLGLFKKQGRLVAYGRLR